MKHFIKSWAGLRSFRAAIALAGVVAITNVTLILGQTEQTAPGAPDYVAIAATATNLTACTCIGDVILRVGDLPVKPKQRKQLLRPLWRARSRIAVCHPLAARKRMVKFVRKTQRLVNIGALAQATADSLAVCARNIGLCGIDCDATAGNLPPVAVARSLVLSADSNCQANPPASQFDYGSYDPGGLIVNRSVTPPGPYPLGSNVVTFAVVDNRGSISSVTTFVVVQDTMGPSVNNFSPNFLVFVTPGQTSGTVTYPPNWPEVSDSCAGVASVSLSPPSGTVLPLNSVTGAALIVVDGLGITNQFSFNIVVLPNSGDGSNLPPVAIARTVTNAADANCQAMVTAAQVDNHSFDPDGTIVSRSVQPAGPFPVGSTTPVTLTVVDNQGASNSTFTTVTVVDLTPPTILIPPTDIAVTPASGQQSVVVYFPTLSVTDTCSSAGVGVSYTPPSGTAFGVGTNTVTCSVFDGVGNTHSTTFQVIVTAFEASAACNTIPGLIQVVEAIPLTGNFNSGRRDAMMKKLQQAQLNFSLKKLTRTSYLLGGFIRSCSIYQDLGVLDFDTASELIICATNIQNHLQ